MFFYLFICARAQQGPHPSEKIIKGWIIWYFSIFGFVPVAPKMVPFPKPSSMISIQYTSPDLSRFIAVGCRYDTIP